MKMSPIQLVFSALCVAYPCAHAKSTVLHAFFNEPKTSTCPNFLSYANQHAKYNELLGLFSGQSLNDFSQSELHLAKHFYEKQEWQTSDANIIRMCHEIVDRELIEQKKGRYTLLHAQPWGFQLLQDFYTQLWSKLHKILCSTYIFARFQPINMTYSMLTKHTKTRIAMLDKGKIASYKKSGKVALCTNFGLFCNNGTQNSFFFFKNNKCRFEPPAHINLKHIFNMLSLSSYYTDFENELIDLTSEHRDLTEYGHILLFSMTAQILEKTVYPTRSGYKLYPSMHIIGKPLSIKQLFDALRIDPWKHSIDHFHFCLILTGDCGLIPNNGLDVYEFNAVAQERLETFEKKKQELIDKIILNIDFRFAQNQEEQDAFTQTVNLKIKFWKQFGCLSSKKCYLS